MNKMVSEKNKAYLRDIVPFELLNLNRHSWNVWPFKFKWPRVMGSFRAPEGCITEKCLHENDSVKFD